MTESSWYNRLQAPSDVDKTIPNDGDGLFWDESLNLWVPGPPGEGSNIFPDGLFTSVIGGLYDSDPSWSMVIIPDTQFMSQSAHRGQLDDIEAWIIANKTNYNIKIVGGTGDLTNSASSDDMSYIIGMYEDLFAAGLTVAPIIGNHDYTNQASRIAATFDSEMSGFSVYAQKDSGSYCNYTLKVTIGSHIYLLVCLEVFPSSSAVSWAETQIATANVLGWEVIVLTHAFQTPGGSRINSLDIKSKSDYAFADDASNGDELWSNLLSKYKILAIASGHWSDAHDHSSKFTDANDQGYVVHQIYADFQAQNFGDSIVGLWNFDPSKGIISISYIKTSDGSIVSEYSYILPYQFVRVSNSMGVLGGFHTYGDISVEGAGVFSAPDSTGVRFQSPFHNNYQTSYIDIGFFREGGETGDIAAIDPPSQCDLHLCYFHGSGSVYIHDGLGLGAAGDLSLGDLFGDNATFTDTVVAYLVDNAYISPRHPSGGGTYYPDIDPPTFGTGDGYPDIYPPTSCDLTFSVYGAGCGQFSGGSTVYYRVFCYIDIPCIGRYFSSTYYETSVYDCSSFSVQVFVYNIPDDADGIEIWRSTDGVNWYYYGDVTDCNIDPCTGYFSFVDPDSSFLTCGTYPTNFLPYGGGTAGNITAEINAFGCQYSSQNVLYRAYSIETITGSGDYFSSTYTDNDFGIVSGDINIKINSFPTSANKIRIYKLVGDICCGNWYYYDFDSITGCVVTDSSLSWTSGSPPPSPLLPVTIGDCGETIPNDVTYFWDDTTEYRAKFPDGTIKRFLMETVT